jgi:TonB-dependent receptor
MKQLLPLTLLLIVSVLFVEQSNATSRKYLSGGMIVGRVLDEQGLALPGATIFITDLENFGTASDVNGDFTLINVPTGEHTIRITYIGYTASEQKIVVEDAVITPVIFNLKSGITMADEVVVLGDRLKGQAKALNQQYSNNNITNIVASDQIGRFPDANIGDAMKRIPGITMQYDQGEARFGIIRGTSPALNSYMINGERVPSAEAETRSVQLDLIPADMVQTIEVNKAITPDMDADAIGGSVNLVTRSAPSGFRLSGTAGAGYGFIRENPITLGNLVVGNRFLNDKLGLILSGSYHNNKFGSDDLEASWVNDDGDVYVEEIEVRKYDVQRVRRSVSAALDYKLNNNHTFFFKGIYNHRDDLENRYRLRFRDLSFPGSESGEIEEVTIVRETKGGGNKRGRNARLEDQRTQNFSFSGDHLFGKVKTNWSATFSKASEERPDERYIAWQIDESAIGNVDFSDPGKPTFTPTSNVAFDQYELDVMTTEDQLTEEKDKNFKLNFIVPLGDNYTNNYIKFGARLRSKNKDRNNSFFETSAVNEFDELMSSHPLADQTLDNFQAGDYAIGQFTSNKYLGGLALRDPSMFELEADPAVVVENFNAKETVSGGFVMLDKMIGKKFSFVAGLRIENTNVEYQGNQFDTEEETIIKTAGKDTYTNILPNVHARYNVADDFVLRAAWTNTLARPNYYNLVPYRLIENVNEILAEGNSSLQPTIAMNFDFMAEKYFQSIGIFSAGAFYKTLEDIIFTYQENTYADQTSGIVFEEYSQPRNGGSATLGGIEVAYQRQLDFLPGALRGLGVYANYTYTKSTADEIVGREGEKLGLPGTANHMLNGSLSFESKKLVVRLSINYTSDYIDEIGEDKFYDRFYDKQTFVDFNASYAITPKWRVFTEANNLTNQSLRYYQGIQARVMQNEFYRQRVTLGVKFDLFETKE